jgi:predicted ABC-type ATPase
MASPQVVVIAGPNGAGKSTAAAYLLPEGMTFINADEIAKTLPGDPSPAADLHAGRLALERMDELERQRADFAVETTLASRSLASRIDRLRRSGYQFRLIFLWSPGADFSVQRVAARVRAGGHDIPEDTIRRRYRAGIKNFFELYQPQADKWAVYDTKQLGTPRLIAEGTIDLGAFILDPETWQRMWEGTTDE